MQRFVKLSQEIANADESLAPMLLDALAQRFSVGLFEEVRREMAVDMASRIGPAEAAAYVAAYEPHVLWTREFLQYRAVSYAAANHPLADKAARDLARFQRNEPLRFEEILTNRLPEQHSSN